VGMRDMVTRGYVLIRGAAGSGKTTTALLLLRQLCDSWLARRERLGLVAPVRRVM
jgi:serine kinase of HPr protein (carbohydrate metabolism regulator)